MKKQEVFIGTLISFISLISADLISSLERGSYGIADILISSLGPIFSVLLGGPDEVLFEKILLFLIITCIVYMVIMKRIDLFNDNKPIVAIITFSISILATRFLLITELVYTIILPYSVLGVALSAFVPIVIAFFFIQQFDSGFLRKTFWILFIVVFWAMWEIRYEDVGAISWIYFWSAVISFLFFLFDGTIRRAMMKQKIIEAGVQTNKEFAREVRRRLRKAHEDLDDGVIDQQEYDELKKKYHKHLKDLAKF